MQKYRDIVIDTNGRPVPGVPVAIQQGGLNVTIYSDNGITPTANPVITDVDGIFQFYTANGTYQAVAGGETETIYLLDPSDVVSLAVFAASNGSSLVGYTEGGAGAIPRTVQTKLRESVTPQDFGAVGDGVANDTAAVQAWANVGGNLFLPPGTYLTDGLTINKVVNVIANPNAVLKLRTGGAGDHNVVTFVGGSDNSTWIGGWADGNRAVLGPSHVSQNDNWFGWRMQGVTGVKWLHVRARNCVTGGALAGGDKHVVDDFRAEDCGKLGVFSGGDACLLRDLLGLRIGNAGLTIWQHGAEIRKYTNSDIGKVRIDGFTLDSAVADGNSNAIEFEDMVDCALGIIEATGYGGGSPVPVVGISINGFLRCTIKSIRSYTFPTSLLLQGGDGYTLDSYELDGAYAAQVGGQVAQGLVVSGAALLYTVSGGALQATTSRSNTGARGVTIGPGEVRRVAGDGMVVYSSIANIASPRVLGSNGNGIVITRASLNGASFPNAPLNPINQVVITTPITIANGSNGVRFESGDGVYVEGGVSCNNGQNTGNAATQRAGLAINGTGTRGRGRFIDLDCVDTQSFTMSGGASFLPGSTDVNNRATFAMLQSGGLCVGQNITLNNATAGGSITGRIYDTVNDYVTVQFSAPQVLSETGNLVALSGTLSTTNAPSGVQTVIVNGSGTAFLTELTGPTWIKVSGQYALVTKVLSNTQLLAWTAFASTFSGQSASKISVDVIGVPSQQYGCHSGSNTVGPLQVWNVKNSGNVIAGNQFDGPTTYLFASGSAVDHNGAMVAQYPDGTTTGGQARGAQAVDWQMSRPNGANLVASGTAATIGGGQNNRAGGNNSVVAGGNLNNASGNNSWIPGGFQSDGHGYYGRGSWTAGRILTNGDAQSGEFSLRVQTVDATPTRLTADGLALSSVNTINLSNFSMYVGRLLVAAKAAGTTDSAAWSVDVAILRGNGLVTTTVFLGASASLAPTGSNGSGSTWRLTIAADTTNGGLALSATGAAATTINWHARYAASEIATAS